MRETALQTSRSVKKKGKEMLLGTGAGIHLYLVVKSVRSPATEEEGVAEMRCAELTTAPIPSPSGGGGGRQSLE